MTRTRRNHLLLAVALVALVALNFPAMMLADACCGPYSLFLYTYGVWFLVILAAGWIAFRKSAP